MVCLIVLQLVVNKIIVFLMKLIKVFVIYVLVDILLQKVHVVQIQVDLKHI